MARHLTGKEARNEKLWCKKVLSYLDPKTGLLMRPKTSFSGHVADPGDNALTLYALVTAYADSKDPALRDAICKMVDHLPRHLQRSSELAAGIWHQEPDGLRAGTELQARLGAGGQRGEERFQRAAESSLPTTRSATAATCTATCGPWSGPPTMPSTSKTRCCSAGWMHSTVTCDPREPVSAFSPRRLAAREISSSAKPVP